MIVVVMGVSGSGKSTVGRALAEALGWAFVEGDDLHSAASIARMRRGEALGDAERGPWLERLRAVIGGLLARGEDAVVACSALRQAYRERLRVDPEAVRFVHLRGDPELIRRRLAARRGHFMSPALLDSQHQTLEAPGDAIAVDVGWPVAEAVDHVVRALGRAPASRRDR